MRKKYMAYGPGFTPFYMNKAQAKKWDAHVKVKHAKQAARAEKINAKAAADWQKLVRSGQSKSALSSGVPAGDAGHWITVNGHHVFVHDGGPGAQKGHVEPSPRTDNPTAPSSKDMASGSQPKEYLLSGFEYT